jgi:hypothetical protein
MGLEVLFRLPFSFGYFSSNSPSRGSSSTSKGKQQAAPSSSTAAGPADPGSGSGSSKQAQGAMAALAAFGPQSPVAAPGASSALMGSSFVMVGYPPSSPEQQPAAAATTQPAASTEAAGKAGKEGDPRSPGIASPDGEVAAAGPSSSSSSGRRGEEKSSSGEAAAPASAAAAAATNTTTTPSSPGTPALMVRRIPVLPEWRERLPLVMAPAKPDGNNTPIGIIKELSGARSIEAASAAEAEAEAGTESGEPVIEIRAQEWQQLKEAEALLRLTFRDYDGVAVWWFYTIPTFVSCIISGTTGTEVPELSNPAVGLKCAIAPYDENSTRRAFFLTCPEWDPLLAAYERIRKGWEYWRRQSLEKQIDRALGVLYGVSMEPIKADGNCLFRAFARAILGDEEKHPETRAAIVAFMRASEELRLFIVSDDEAEDSGAFAERYLEEMGKPGTWGDQVEITAFTRVYGRSVRVFSYNYSENRLLSVGTPIEEGAAAKGPEVWLLHLHGHYSLLKPGVAPKDEGWERMLREFEEEKGEQPAAVAAAAAAAAAVGLKQEKGRKPPSPSPSLSPSLSHGQGPQRPGTPAVAVEQEESKQEGGGGRMVLRAFGRRRSISSSSILTTTTGGAVVTQSLSSSSLSEAVTGSVVMVECSRSSRQQVVSMCTAATPAVLTAQGE